jgi:hypothetical protein
MSWEQKSLYGRYNLFQSRTQPPAFGINKQCFIRKEHECGKIFGASKSCFIACPTNDNLEPTLALISEKLSRSGVESYIAVKERAYGQDIFCTKICGKIIESRFCLVILDDTIVEENNFPNPNIYYEYGLMTSLRKHIIPLQKDGQKLAFNIQSYDTIKYNNTNISSELDRAFRDAVRISDEKNVPIETGEISEKTMLRRLELSGLREVEEEKDEELINIIKDTQFKGFWISKENSYVLLGKIDNEDELLTYLEDLDILIYRIENLVNNVNNSIPPIKQKLETLTKQSINKPERVVATLEERERTRELESLERMLKVRNGIIGRLLKVGIGFIIKNELDVSKFTSKVNEITSQCKRYQCAYSANGELLISDISIDLRSHQ